MADNDSRQGSRYAEPELIAWVDNVHAAHDAALDSAFSAPDGEQMPSIMIGRSEGRMLELLLRLAGAEKVVEVGTLAGYSALRMAAALPPSGKVWTIEYDPAHVSISRAIIERAGMADRIEVLEGAALDILPTLEKYGPFDAVFIDADKGNYDKYGDWAAANLRQGGLLLGDNAYLFGRLLEDSDAGAAMRAFHERAADKFDSVCLPTPDGMVLGIKR